MICFSFVVIVKTKLIVIIVLLLESLEEKDVEKDFLSIKGSWFQIT